MLVRLLLVSTHNETHPTGTMFFAGIAKYGLGLFLQVFCGLFHTILINYNWLDNVLSGILYVTFKNILLVVILDSSQPLY